MTIFSINFGEFAWRDLCLCLIIGFNIQAFAFNLDEDLSKANNGDKIAQEKIGICYLLGTATDHDYAKALKYLTLANKNGSNIAPFLIGIIYQNGLNVL